MNRFFYFCNQNNHSMKVKLPCILLVTFFIVVFYSCHSSKEYIQSINESQPLATKTIENLPLPCDTFKFSFPLVELVKEPEQLETNEPLYFTENEKRQIAVANPQLFTNNDTEIIDLSLLPKGSYAFPLPGAKVISPYGGRRKHHSGIDLKTKANDTIIAAFDGTVRMSQPYFAYGKVIVIRHYNGLETIYSHNSKNLAKVGDVVKAGQPIALTGRTGRATTEHLHFEIRLNGKHFNPDIIFDFSKNDLKRKYLVCTKKGNDIDIKSVNPFPYSPSLISFK